METQAKHTPTPWRVDTSEDTNGMIIRATTEEGGDSYEDIVAELESPDILLSLDSVPEDRETEAKANAEFIVKACNSYEKLSEIMGLAFTLAAMATSQYKDMIEMDNLGRRLLSMITKQRKIQNT